MSNPEVEKNLRILVVDDNHAIHEDFRKILCAGPPRDSALEQAESLLFDAGAKPAAPRRLVFEVDSAFQGQEGLEKARLAKESGRPYAMAFVDVRMPPGLGRHRNHRPHLGNLPGPANRHLHRLFGLFLGGDVGETQQLGSTGHS